jgi:hypothetical protein
MVTCCASGQHYDCVATHGYESTREAVITGKKLAAMSTSRATVPSSSRMPASSGSKASSRSARDRPRSGRSPDWLKMKNQNAPAVKREAEEDWGR